MSDSSSSSDSDSSLSSDEGIKVKKSPKVSLSSKKTPDVNGGKKSKDDDSDEKKKKKKKDKVKKESKDKKKKDKKKKEKKKKEKKPKKEKDKSKDKKKSSDSSSSSDSEASLKAEDVAKKKKGSKSNNSSADVGSSSSSLGDSGTRIATIDPNSAALPKLKRPELPQFEETPDWMFKPSEDKLKGIGALGISGRMAMQRKMEKQRSNRTLLSGGNSAGVSKESKAYASNFMKSLDVKARSKLLLDGIKTDEDKLIALLNHDPYEKNYDDEVTRNFLSQHPDLCEKKYRFDISPEEIYPLSMLSALGASSATLKVCYKAYKDALLFNDQWIGTALHYACAYRAPMEVLKFLHSKDEDEEMIEALNQRKRLPMHIACMLKTPLENIEFLIKENKSSLSQQDVDGMTPLHFACNRTDPQLEVIELLTSKNKKACVMQNNKGCTPLHLAVQHGTPTDVLECLLVANDKAFSISDKAGNLPVHTALHVNADRKIVQFVVWNYSEGLAVYNDKDERPIDMAKRIYKKDKELHEILEPE